LSHESIIEQLLKKLKKKIIYGEFGQFLFDFISQIHKK